MPLPLVILLIALLFVTMPLWIPLVAVLDYRERKRRRAVAMRTRCTTCGTVLGMAALSRADADWGQYVSALFKANPGIRFRLVRHVFAICGTCSAEYDYDTALCVFTPVATGSDKPYGLAPTGTGPS